MPQKKIGKYLRFWKNTVVIGTQWSCTKWGSTQKLLFFYRELRSKNIFVDVLVAMEATIKRVLKNLQNGAKNVRDQKFLQKEQKMWKVPQIEKNDISSKLQNHCFMFSRLCVAMYDLFWFMAFLWSFVAISLFLVKVYAKSIR